VPHVAVSDIRTMSYELDGGQLWLRLIWVQSTIIVGKTKRPQTGTSTAGITR
jgi:hypothetical protein